MPRRKRHLPSAKTNSKQRRRTKQRDNWYTNNRELSNLHTTSNESPATPGEIKASNDDQHQVDCNEIESKNMLSTSSNQNNHRSNETHNNNSDRNIELTENILPDTCEVYTPVDSNQNIVNANDSTSIPPPETTEPLASDVHQNLERSVAESFQSPVEGLLDDDDIGTLSYETEETHIQPTFITTTFLEHSNSTTINDVDFDVLKTNMNIICSSSSFISIITTTGVHKSTSTFYHFLRLLLGTYCSNFSLQSYRSVQRTIWAFMKQECLPASHLIDLRYPSSFIDETKPYNPTHCVRVLKPSEWAKLDVRTKSYFHQLVHDPPESNGPNIFKSRIFSHRKELSSLDRILFVSNNEASLIAYPTDIVQFPISSSCPNSFFSCWYSLQPITSSYHSNQNNVIEAELGPIWIVHSGTPTTSLTKHIIQTQFIQSSSENEANLLNIVNSGKVKAIDLSDFIKEKRENIHVQSIDTEFVTSLDNTFEMKHLIQEGDYCAILRSCNHISSGFTTSNQMDFCVFVARYLLRETCVRPRQEILWLRLDDKNNLLLLNCTNVTGIPELIKQSLKNQQRDEARTHVSRTGFLDNGTRYVRYPFAGYHDDFNPRSTLYPMGSVGGMYILPLAFWNRTKICPSSARIISLTPPGESTCKVINIIIEDIVTGMTSGIPSIDPDGNEIIIFLDFVCFIADYPAVSPTIDTKSHSANVPCTVCTFPRMKNLFESAYGHSTTINMRNPSHMRCTNRTLALRNTHLNSIELVNLGMREFHNDELNTTPMFNLFNQLRTNALSQIQRSTIKGSSVNSLSFDPYMAVVEAPDHCLMGVIKNAMDMYFSALSDNKLRRQVDAMVCTAIDENGLPKQASIYNTSKRSINSMTMTAVFSSFLILESIARQHIQSNQINEHVLDILTTLQTLIRNLYWWPIPSVDGPVSIPFTGVTGLQNINMECEKMVKALTIKVNTLSQLDRNLGHHMDKPNLHRLLEMCHHSIFAYGNVHNFAEMGLETVHQILKKALHGNTKPNKHITAVFHAMCADWIRRILHAFKTLSSAEGNQTRLRTLRNIAILMLGNRSRYLNILCNEHIDFLNEFQSRLNDVLKEPLLSYMIDQSHYNLPVESDFSQWILQKKITDPNVFKSNLIEQGISLLSQMCAVNSHDVVPYETASFVRLKKNELTGRNYAYNTLTYGNSIQVCASRPNLKQKLCNTSNSTESVCEELSLSYFAVHGFLHINHTERKYAIAQKLKKTSESRVYHLSTTNFQLVEMSPSVRRIAMVHNCVNCKLSTTRNRIIHDANIFSNSSYILIPRMCGFPPRLA